MLICFQFFECVQMSTIKNSERKSDAKFGKMHLDVIIFMQLSVSVYSFLARDFLALRFVDSSR